MTVAPTADDVRRASKKRRDALDQLERQFARAGEMAATLKGEFEGREQGGDDG